MSRDCVLLAGGLGTRLLPVTGGLIPKAMVPVLGRPFIDFKLRSLVELGVDRVVMLVGERSDALVEHVGDGRRFGLRTEYVHDGPALKGTGGAIHAALALLPEHFWVSYGDSIVVADLDRSETELSRLGCRALMTVLRNHDRWGPSNVAIADDLVVRYEKHPDPGQFEWTDYGLLLFDRRAFEDEPITYPTDLGVVLRSLIASRSCAAMPVTERFWEVGTPEALAETEAHLSADPAWASWH
jgi:NDP-sugar pyrophosphorylase family protein